MEQVNGELKKENNETPNAASGAGKGAKPTGGHAHGARPGKIAPVSPSAARLARRANDEKIVRSIKIAFTSVVTVAIVGVLVSLFLFFYKPAVGTVGGQSIEQYEYSFYLAQSAGTGTAETAAQSTLDSIAEIKLMGIIAGEKGITLSDESAQAISQDLANIDQQAASASQDGTWQTGDELIRSYFGVSKAQYRKLMEAQMLAGDLITAETDAIAVPDEDARAQYDAALESYEEATVRHILFLFEGKADAETPRTREESEKLAQDTLARIDAGEDMATLVQELSEDTVLTNEGIYTFRGDGTAPNPDGTVSTMDPGFVSWTFDPARNVGDTGIAETSYGFHVMMLDAKRDIPFDEVKEEIVTEIKNAQIEALVEGWKAEPRFQVQKNQSVVDELTGRVMG